MDIFTLIAAVASPDDVVRNQAEAALSSAERTNPGAYFLALAQELQNEARDDPMRQQAGLLMKVSLFAAGEALNNEKQGRWRSLNAVVRKSIKDLITATLGASTPLARAAAAQVIAKVGAIEIQPGNNEWPELLGGLFGVISRVDLPEGPRASALTALGYLLEELDAYTDSPLSQPEVDCALTTICACVHVPAGAPPLPLHIQRAAVEALYNTLPFVAANFANDRANERDSIMFAICSATQCPDTKVRESAFQCIERIAELYYDYVGPYMKVLADLTAAAAKGADENVATHALGFWSEIAEAEAERKAGTAEEPNNRYIEAALAPLVSMLTDIMCTVKEDADDSEYGPAESAQACFQAVAGAAGRPLLQAVLPFITANFMSPDWQKRDAAIMCLALLQDSGEEASAEVAKVDSEALSHVMSRFLLGGATRDASTIVRSSAAFCAANIFSSHVKVAMSAPGGGFSAVMAALVGSLGDEPMVAKHVVNAINNLVVSAQELEDGFVLPDGRSSILSPLLFGAINALIVRADKDDADECDLRMNCYLAISALVEAAREGDHPMLVGLLRDVTLARIRTALSAPAGSSDERDKRVALLETLLGMVDNVLFAVRGEVAVLLPTIMELVLRCVDARVAEDCAWSVVANCADMVCGERAFMPYLSEVHPRLLAGLRSVANHEICQQCILAAGAVMRNLETALPADKLGEYMGAFMGILSNANAARELKPPAIAGFADAGRAVEPFLPHILPIIGEAVRLPDPDNDDDEDLRDYILELRKSCLAAWTGILMGLSADGDAPPAVAAAAQQKAHAALAQVPGPRLIDAIAGTLGAWAASWRANMAADPEDVPDLELAKSCVGVLGDIVQALGKEAVGPAFAPFQVNLKWLVDACHGWEVEDDTDPADTIAAITRSKLGLR